MASTTLRPPEDGATHWTNTTEPPRDRNQGFLTAHLMPKANFDAEAFYSALDGQRRSRRLHWKQVADQAGVSASTLTRMAQGRRPDIDSLAALLNWSGLDANDFVRSQDAHQAQPEPLAMISTYLRSDPNLSQESAIALEELIKATYERLRNR